MPTSSRLTPCYLPICTEKYFFVPLPTLKSVFTPTPPRPREKATGTTKNIIYYGKIKEWWNPLVH